MAGGLGRTGVPGRHTRRAEARGLRRACLAALTLLIVQYGAGIYLNFYVEIPASDAHASFMREVATAPPMLTVHALLGLGLIVTAIVLLGGAIRARDRIITTLATVGLGAIGSAFAEGEMFVRNGQDGASFAMAVLTGVALLCYVGALAAARPAPHPARAAPHPARPAPHPAWTGPSPRRDATGPLPRRPAPVRPHVMAPHAMAPNAMAPQPRSQPPSWFARD